MSMKDFKKNTVVLYLTIACGILIFWLCLTLAVSFGYKLLDVKSTPLPFPSTIACQETDC